MFRKQQEERLNVDKGKNKVMIKPHRPGYQERGNKCRQGQGTSRIPPLIAAFEGCGGFQMLSNIPHRCVCLSSLSLTLVSQHPASVRHISHQRAQKSPKTHPTIKNMEGIRACQDWMANALCRCCN